MENLVGLDRSQMTIWRVRIEFWVTKATDTNSEFLILIAFPLQKRCTNAPVCNVIRTSPVSFLSTPVTCVLPIYAYW